MSSICSDQITVQAFSRLAPPPEQPDDAATARAKKGRRPQKPKQYRCKCCAKVFKRKEHCVRHERAHTQEKPYSCNFCQKSYSRKDLLTRHERSLHVDLSQEESVFNPSIKPRISIEAPPSGGDEDVQNMPRLLVPRRLMSWERRPSLSSSEDSRSGSNAPAGIGAGKTILAPAPAHEIYSSPVDPEAGLSIPKPAAHPVESVGDAQTTSHADLFVDMHNDLDLYNFDQHMLTDSEHATQKHQEHQGSQILQTDAGLIGARTQQKHQQDQQQHHRRHVYNVHHQPEYETSEVRHQQPQQLQATFQKQYDDLDVPPPSTNSLPPEPTLPAIQPDLTTSVDFAFFSSIQDSSLGMFMDQNVFDIPDVMSGPEPSPGSLYRSTVGADTRGPRQHSDTQQRRHIQRIESYEILPILSEEKRSPQPVFKPDQGVLDSIYRDLNHLLEPKATGELPSAKICEGLIATYIECFHIHLPFIHLHTLNLHTTPSPLLLMMCSIGALYRLDQRRARVLYDLTARSMEKLCTSSTPRTSSNTPDLYDFTSPNDGASPDQQTTGGGPFKSIVLWVVQTRLLMSLYEVLSGDKDLVSSAMRDNGFYTLIYTKARVSLAEEHPDVPSMSWEKWVTRESWKRLLASIYMTSTLIMVIYDVNPGFNQAHDLDLEVLHLDSLWNATSAAEWQQLRANSTKGDRRTIKDVLTHVMTNRSLQSRWESYQVTPFTALFVMHAVVVQMRQLSQVAQTFTLFIDIAPDVGQGSVGSQLLQSALNALDRCREFLQRRPSGTADNPHDEAQTSMTSSCRAMLRIAYTRLFNIQTGFDRLNLIESDIAAVEFSVSNLATSKLERNPHVVQAVRDALWGFRTPVKLGHILIRKTAAFYWSLEHAVSAWDCALFVTRWIHSIEVDVINAIEPTSEEQDLLILIRNVLEEADCELTENMSMAAGVARTWGLFLQDVWVWGITPRMGEILEHLATAYEQVNGANRRQLNG